MSLVVPRIWVLGKLAGEHGAILLYPVQDQRPMFCGHAFHCRAAWATVAPYYQWSIWYCIVPCLCEPVEEIIRGSNIDISTMHFHVAGLSTKNELRRKPDRSTPHRLLAR